MRTLINLSSWLVACDYWTNHCVRGTTANQMWLISYVWELQWMIVRACMCACVWCVCGVWRACVRACVHACGGCVVWRVCGVCVAGYAWCMCGARVVRVTLVTDWVGQRQWMKTKFNVKNEYVRMPMKTNELHYDVFVWSSILIIDPSVLQAIKCWQNRHQTASFGVSTFNIHARPGFSEKSG